LILPETPTCGLMGKTSCVLARADKRHSVR
jgi:hypothetical protein